MKFKSVSTRPGCLFLYLFKWWLMVALSKYYPCEMYLLNDWCWLLSVQEPQSIPVFFTDRHHQKCLLHISHEPYTQNLIRMSRLNFGPEYRQSFKDRLLSHGDVSYTILNFVVCLSLHMGKVMHSTSSLTRLDLLSYSCIIAWYSLRCWLSLLSSPWVV